MDGYAERSSILREMGYESYEDYLKSRLWYTTKQKVFAEKGVQCSICLRTAKVIHHLEYTPENLSGENTEGLVPLCFRCHHIVEIDRFGQKRSLEEAQMTYLRLFHEAKRSRLDDF